ncbi:MAG: hypothetical protein CSA73_00545 [Rhodobacterales bacterium]|nr:MAG: hypothetical protein CSA73_00545 [Rhodobacterales bacterium]
MNTVARKFEVVEGGSAMSFPASIGEPIAEPLTNADLWLDAEALSELASVSDRAAQKALKARKWRGADLLVREIEIGRGGAGGRALQVHVDSLPPDLREAWYLERGVKLHEKVDAATGETILIPEAAYLNDKRHEADLAQARWRHEVIRPILILPRQSAGRAALIKELAAQPRLFPNGQRKAVTPQTIYNWVKAFEAEGLHGLMRKRRSDVGARRTGITRAWDGLFAPHIDEATHNGVADES